MSEVQLQAFDDRQALDRHLAGSVADALAAAVRERGHAVLVVSGGSTPLGFFRALSQAPLPWERVRVTLADERWVPPAHEDSNERLVREHLLVGAAAAAQFVSLVTDDARPAAAEAAVEARIAALGTFDVVVLGMGGDGHTASLFPGSDALSAGLDLHSGRSCLAVQPLAAAHERMSLTLPRLLATRALYVHITGDAKRALLERAAVENDPLVLPVAAILAATAPQPKVYWAP